MSLLRCLCEWGQYTVNKWLFLRLCGFIYPMAKNSRPGNSIWCVMMKSFWSSFICAEWAQLRRNLRRKRKRVRLFFFFFSPYFVPSLHLPVRRWVDRLRISAQESGSGLIDLPSQPPLFLLLLHDTFCLPPLLDPPVLIFVLQQLVNWSGWS